jgi:VIT1/CCC1 family predicted Fe2+/Mn2+ transporter
MKQSASVRRVLTPEERIPVVIPFLVIRSPSLALRVSNAVAVAMLFVAGFTTARLTGPAIPKPSSNPGA